MNARNLEDFDFNGNSNSNEAFGSNRVNFGSENNSTLNNNDIISDDEENKLEEEEDNDHENDNDYDNRILKNGNSSNSSSRTSNKISIVSSEKKRKNTEASARFRIKRKEREQKLSDEILKINERINKCKVKVKTLEMENNCLKQMLLGTNLNFESGSLPQSKNIGTMSNYELLQLLKNSNSSDFKITSS